MTLTALAFLPLKILWSITSFSFMLTINILMIMKDLSMHLIILAVVLGAMLMFTIVKYTMNAAIFLDPAKDYDLKVNQWLVISSGYSPHQRKAENIL